MLLSFIRLDCLFGMAVGAAVEGNTDVHNGLAQWGVRLSRIVGKLIQKDIGALSVLRSVCSGSGPSV